MPRTQIPIQLAEISPPAFRATFPGVAYQLGNVSPSVFAWLVSRTGPLTARAVSACRWSLLRRRRSKPVSDLCSPRL